jgi:hypothetical protein
LTAGLAAASEACSSSNVTDCRQYTCTCGKRVVSCRPWALCGPQATAVRTVMLHD